jgi:flagellar hook protein FlgE
MLAMANFNNPSGLEKIGNNLYAATVNSGDFTGGVAAGSGGTGTLSTGTLEMSNVDLSDSLSEMMIAQRAYQANSKIITTTDSILETVINMIR